MLPAGSLKEWSEIRRQVSSAPYANMPIALPRPPLSRFGSCEPAVERRVPLGPDAAVPGVESRPGLGRRHAKVRRGRRGVGSDAAHRQLGPEQACLRQPGPNRKRERQHPGEAAGVVLVSSGFRWLDSCLWIGDPQHLHCPCGLCARCSQGAWPQSARTAQPISQTTLQSGGEAAASPAGKRLFVFVVGGITYSEIRAVHRLSARLNRDIYLGSTNVETPARYLADLAALSQPVPEGAGALEIETPLRQKF